MHIDYLVYEHWRPDTNTCFYVGKGNARSKRAYNLARGQRQAHHTNIIKKLRRSGLDIVVRVVAENLPEESSFALEKMRIAYWRALGVELVNRTDGGDGPAGRKHTEEHKAYLSRINRGRVHSPEAIKKMRANNAMKRPEVRAKVSGENAPMRQPAMRARMRDDNPMHRPDVVAKMSGEGNPFFGRKHTEETKAKIRASKIGKKLTDDHRKKLSAVRTGRVMAAEQRAKLSEIRVGENNPFFGQKHTEETKAKIRASQALRRAEKELGGTAASVAR